MDRLPARENTNFPLAVYKALEALPDEDFLLKHQVAPARFFSQYPKARGLLLMTETGGGKSITAAAIADEYISLGRRPIMIVAKSLQMNMRDNIIKYKQSQGLDEATARERTEKEYTFVSANANNMLSQLQRSTAEQAAMLEIEEDDADVVVPNVTEISLEGAFVIVDEAHHLFNGVVSGSKNARGLYEVITRTRDIRVLFLTSSVITNTPFEIVPCFNMIAGYELLPVHYDDFMEMFIDAKNGRAKHLDHFKSRIFGLTSYYGSWYQHGGALGIHQSIVREGFPVRLPIIEVYVPMSAEQYGAYINARSIEISSKKSSSGRKRLPLIKPGKATNYRIASRQLGNFWAPTEIDITANLDVHSPKTAALLTNIKKHDGQIGFIFSSFVHTHGILWIAKVLDANGYTQFHRGDTTPGLRYAIASGDLTAEERNATLAEIWAPLNLGADIVSLVLGSPAMAEGVNTKRIRHVHIFEPSWHWAAIEQVIARAVRLHSHDELPPDQRAVQAYLYLADYPIGLETKPDEPTTDISLLYSSIKKKVLNDQFYGAMIEASIDCSVHIRAAGPAAKKSIKCMMCTPTDRPMFIRSITEDMAHPVTCRQAGPKSIEVAEIEYAGKSFFYRKEPSGALHIYTFDERTSSYVKLPQGSKWWRPLFEKLS